MVAHLEHITAILYIFCYPKQKKMWFCFPKQEKIIWFAVASEKISVIVFPSKRKCVFLFPSKIKSLILFSQVKIFPFFVSTIKHIFMLERSAESHSCVLICVHT